MSKPDFATAIAPHTLDRLVVSWLEEDVPTLDIGGHVVGDVELTATLYCKAVLCGRPFFDAVFNHLKCKVVWESFAQEGEVLDATAGKLACAIVTGPVRNLLLGERTALNVLSRTSGIATRARAGVNACREKGWKGMVAGTRKTTPGFRLCEKYACIVAGAASHRDNLSSMVMLKDNHIWATGSITAAVEKAKIFAGFTTKIEVETDSLESAREATLAGADIVMLDNFEPSKLHETAACLKREFPHIILEASGGIEEGNIVDYTGPDIDVISKSWMQSYEVIDFSLKINTPKR
eukprot:TRINITY_DN17147_c0_g1_i1.p1 TRINITY_DN17147_c0_g1~~TRINITY_DN17147_c0_g1_i1.p1  ORF type:complete len:293 (-),score=51.78 TRINITY_DN17147_c0_g1_i1:134-1012(-)